MIRNEVVLFYDERKGMSRLGYKIEEGIHHFYQKDLSKIPRKDLLTILVMMFGCNKQSNTKHSNVFVYQNNTKHSSTYVYQHN